MQNQGMPTSAKPTTLNELLNKFSDQIDKMEKNNNRLRQISISLEIEPPSEPMTKEPTEALPFNEGGLLYFHNHLANLTRQNQQFDYQLSRIEKHI